MKNFVKKGEVLDYLASADIASGDIVVAGTLIGVAVTDIANGEVGAVSLKGCYELPKVTGAIGQGAKVYLIVADGTITTTASGNTFIGNAAEAELSAATTVKVILANGI